MNTKKPAAVETTWTIPCAILPNYSLAAKGWIAQNVYDCYEGRLVGS